MGLLLLLERHTDIQCNSINDTMDTISRTYTVVMAILLHLLFFLDIGSNPMSSGLGRTAILHDVPDAEELGNEDGRPRRDEYPLRGRVVARLTTCSEYSPLPRE